MNYIMYFDIAALFIISTVIIHYSGTTNIQTNQTRAFQLLVFFDFLSGIFDLFIVYGYNLILTLPPAFNYLFNIIYLICFNVLTPIYFYYICLVVKKRSEFGCRLKAFIIIPAAVEIFLILTTGITKWIFYLDENNVYCHGGGMTLVYIIACYYLIAGIAFVAHYREKFTFEQRVSVYFFTGVLMVAVILQFVLLKQIMISEFASALSVLMVYLSLEDRDDYADKHYGTYNRNAFIKLATAYIESNKKFDVLCIQIHGFKTINDTLGIKNGDIIMDQVISVLRQAAGKKRVFRISGIRYAIIADHGGSQCAAMSKILNERFESPFLVHKIEISLSPLMCSMSYPETIQNVDDVLATLESSFEDFKRTDSTLVTLSDKVRDVRRHEYALLQILHHAMHNNEFEIYYQPIYSVEERRFTCAEALLRLKNNELGYISPEEFIPLAEKNGLILDIGEFVFRDVCRFISENNISALGIEYIEINLSVVQCMQEKLHETLLNIIDEYGVPYSSINLEITETSAIVSSETFISNMNRLNTKGITFALDDYGTGYSTTSTLTSYPFSIVKLDKSMVWSAFEQPKAMSALKYTIKMIKHMDMKIVAEGVESFDQAKVIADLGCDYIQGYFYSRPIAATQFLELLAH